ncbi:molybdopterin-dependent oxidoreductase [Deefgea sp. CFH1-16]|uniref:molybdopterin-dependent oxidoreductase n=1 Tax=Deefgea sp. CFH1-16 TaxID=2675457 RepID=UPI0015F49F17|nr:molybdopterin-dependent oxidoreductase [Deefgea sp. CFH1-16]MBM5573864.1 molybdopterin-dependent oxidoreductase [Deefgea sp. CFH1-16]
MRWIVFFGLFFCSTLALAQTVNSNIILTVTGKSANSEVQLTAHMIAKLPQQIMTMRTAWYPTEQTFEGPLLRDVLKLVGIQSGDIKLRSLNDYTISIPVSDALQYDVIIARKRNGQLMTIRDKGPLFVIYPFHQHENLRRTEYYRRCSWQLRSIAAE